jgi:general secretion pathway protein H
MMPRRASSDGGFTLLELLAALIIASAALAFVVPLFTGSGNAKAVQKAASTLLAKLDQTRSKAMSAGKPVSFTIDPATRSYRTDDGAGAALPSGISFSSLSTPQLIVFRPDGTATPAQFGLRKGRARADVGIDWLTGRASVSFSR